MGQQVASDVTCALVAQAVAFALLFFAFRKRPIYDRAKGTLVKQPSTAEKLDAIDGIFCQPFFMLLAGISVSAAWELGFTNPSIEVRWRATTSASYWFQVL